MRATIFPTKIEVTRSRDDDMYTDVELSDELGGAVDLHLTQDMRVALWKGLGSPRMVGDEPEPAYERTWEAEEAQ